MTYRINAFVNQFLCQLAGREHPFNYGFFQSKFFSPLCGTAREKKLRHCFYSTKNCFLRHMSAFRMFFSAHVRYNFLKKANLLTENVFPQKTIAPPPHPSS